MCLFSPSNDCNHNSMMTKIVKHYPFHPVLLGSFLASFMICTVLSDAARKDPTICVIFYTQFD